MVKSETLSKYVSYGETWTINVGHPIDLVFIGRDVMTYDDEWLCDGDTTKYKSYDATFHTTSTGGTLYFSETPRVSGTRDIRVFYCANK